MKRKRVGPSQLIPVARILEGCVGGEATVLVLSQRPVGVGECFLVLAKGDLIDHLRPLKGQVSSGDEMVILGPGPGLPERRLSGARLYVLAGSLEEDELAKAKALSEALPAAWGVDLFPSLLKKTKRALDALEAL